MKATVWTSWNTRASDYKSGKPRCIFRGEIAFPPHAGDYIVVCDGYSAERVTSVIHDYVTGEVEIAVATPCDSDYPTVDSSEGAR